MAAMKPRTGDGPLEVTKEGRGIVMRVPLEGGGRLVVEMSADEADALGEALKSAVSYAAHASAPVRSSRTGAACCPDTRPTREGSARARRPQRRRRPTADAGRETVPADPTAARGAGG